MANYGVVPTGFSRKPLAVTQAEIEAQLVTEFGPQIIQTSQSPLGQLNGLMAAIITELWELGEDVYQAYDVDQAEGGRLDALGKLRLLRRGTGETDVQFRKAVTNQGYARVDLQDIVRAIRSVPGVTYAQVFLNETGSIEVTGIPPGAICVAVLGGDEDDIAEQIRRYIVPGIDTYGNTPVSTVMDGFCRSLMILRPILIPVTLNVRVRASRDVMGCPPPAVTAIKATLVSALQSSLINGDDITYFKIRSIIESAFPNVEVLYFIGQRDGISQIENAPVSIGFIEMATIDPTNVFVSAE